jgi:four helix bundle protein
MLKLAHKELEVWKFAKRLVSEVYQMTSTFPKEEMFGITNQLRRASVSVVSNIAEGSSRKSAIEKKRFYEISRSSIVEIDAQLEISVSLGFVKTDDIKSLEETINHVFAMVTKMIEAQKID